MRYVFGDYVLDTLCYKLRQAGSVVPLRPKVFHVLAYILTHHDRVVLKHELLEHLWPGQYVGDAALNYSIMEVRKALGDDGHIQRLLRTVRERGYRFVALVEVQDQMPSANAWQAVRSLAAEATGPELPPTPPAVGFPTAADPTNPAVPDADGEYKPVSVLCCALGGAPTLTVQLGPEGLYQLLEIVVGLAQEVFRPTKALLSPRRVRASRPSLARLWPRRIMPDEPCWRRSICTSACASTRPCVRCPPEASPCAWACTRA